MKRFLTDADYSDQIRDEILDCISEKGNELLGAEEKALSQMKMRLAGRYDIDAIFNAEGLERNAFVVMTMIDITLYHLWSKERGRIPQIRQERYQDAIEWLKGVSTGSEICNLPALPDEDITGGFQVWSCNPPENHRY